MMYGKEYKKTTNKTVKRSVIYKDGKFYYTKEAERKVLFVLTILLLFAGLLYEAGILR